MLCITGILSFPQGMCAIVSKSSDFGSAICSSESAKRSKYVVLSPRICSSESIRVKKVYFGLAETEFSTGKYVVLSPQYVVLSPLGGINM